jgi:hypothetical protein
LGKFFKIDQENKMSENYNGSGRDWNNNKKSDPFDEHTDYDAFQHSRSSDNGIKLTDFLTFWGVIGMIVYGLALLFN